MQKHTDTHVYKSCDLTAAIEGKYTILLNQSPSLILKQLTTSTTPKNATKHQTHIHVSLYGFHFKMTYSLALTRFYSYKMTAGMTN